MLLGGAAWRLSAGHMRRMDAGFGAAGRPAMRSASFAVRLVVAGVVLVGRFQVRGSVMTMA